jgi:N-carbamoylputrescine amidase
MSNTPRTLSLGVIQTHYGLDMDANIARTTDFVRQAADKGAQVVLPSELFQGPYFCVTQEERWFATAHP